jgi:hypothetical protein
MVIYLYKEFKPDDDNIKKIGENIKQYNNFFKDISVAPIGKYTINQILEIVEESLNYLEINYSELKKWAENYLDKNRGELWLYYGISKGNYLTDYWKIRETNFSELSSIWPFLYGRKNPKYKNFIVDLEEAQDEVLRQRDRQNTSNPNYVQFHPGGCPSGGCCCWMLDDMEQWYEEEKKEIDASHNVFFNNDIQKEFYNIALNEINDYKNQWENWVPDKKPGISPKEELKQTPGQTLINIVITWIKYDFYYSSIYSMFEFSDVFVNVWNNIDSIENFIKCERKKLKEIVELL